jgi:hypothetical protein
MTDSTNNESDDQQHNRNADSMWRKLRNPKWLKITIEHKAVNRPSEQCYRWQTANQTPDARPCNPDVNLQSETNRH